MFGVRIDIGTITPYLKITRIVFILSLLLGSLNVSAQDDYVVVFHGKVSVYGSSVGLETVKVTLYDGGTKIEEQITAKNGRYEFEVPVGGNYKLKFSRSGWVSKHLTIDTRGIHEEDLSDFDFQIDMELFKEIPDLDVSILDQPIGKAKWDPGIGDIAWDMDYTADIQKQLQKLMEEAKEKQEELERLAEEEAERLEQMQHDYDQALGNGDKYYSKGDWENAIAEYTTAMNVFDDDNDAALETLIKDAQTKLDEETAANAADEEYNALMLEGEKLMKAQEWEDAIAVFENALEVKPGEPKPQEQIDLAKQEMANAANEAVEKEYQDLLAQAEEALNDEDYGYAKSLYQQASAVKPEESFPPDQIKMIDDLINANLAKEEEFNNLMSDGQKLLVEEKFDDAIAKFEAAADIKPEDEMPPEKIEEALRLKDQAAADALDEEFYGIIAQADKEFDNQNYEESRGLYQDALALKDDSYAESQIEEIDKLLGEMADLEENYAKLIQDGKSSMGGGDFEDAIAQFEGALELKPGEQEPQDLIDEANRLWEQANQQAIDDEYNAIMAEANDAFGSEDWEEARGLYQDALAVKENEQEPQDKINEIDDILAQLEADALAAEEAERIQQEYDDKIAEAQDAFDAEEYEDSRALFVEAGDIKPEETLPPEKIEEIDGILAQLEADRLAQEEAERLQQEYDDLMAQASDEFGAEDYENALTSYQAASAIFPDEEEPIEKIEEIKEILEQIEADLLAQMEQDEIDAEYAALIEEADGLRDSEDWQAAINKYELAQQVKPEEDYPETEIEKINDLLADMEARKAEYDELIASGLDEMANEQYDDAIADFEEAAELFPNEDLPPNKIAEINDILAQLELDEQAAADLAAKQEEYDQLIKDGQDAIDDESFEEAIGYFEQAGDIFPDETLPPDKIAEINNLIAQRDASAEEAERLAEYQGLVDQGLDAMDDEAWEEAIGYFEQAGDLMPDESLPPKKIDEINDILAQIAADEQSAADLAALEAEYESYMAEANDAFDAENWQVARSNYEKASGVFSDRREPKDRIDEIDDILAQIQADQDAALLAEQQQEIEDRYNEIIAEADALRVSEDWNDAISKYNEALGVKPNANYPRERINEINGILNDMLAAEELAEKQEEYDTYMNSANLQYNKGNYETAKSLYGQAQMVMNTPEVQDKLVEVNNAINGTNSTTSNVTNNTTNTTTTNTNTNNTNTSNTTSTTNTHSGGSGIDLTDFDPYDYGTQISMSEAEIDEFLQDQRDQDAADRYAVTELEKNDKSDLEQQGVNTEDNIVDENMAQIQMDKDDQIERHEEGDLNRQDAVWEVDQQFQDISEDEIIKMDGQTEHIDEVMATNIQNQDDWADDHADRDVPRQDRVEEFDETFVEISDEEIEKLDGQLIRTGSALESYEDAMDENVVLHQERDEPRQEDVTVMDGMFVDIREVEEDKIEDQLEYVYDVDETFRDDVDQRADDHVERDVPRQDRVEEFDETFETISEEEIDKIDAQDVRTDVTMDDFRDDQDDWRDVTRTYDEPREDRVEVYDETFVEISEWTGENQYRQFGDIEKNEQNFRDIQDQQSEFRVDAYGNYEQTVEDMDEVKQDNFDYAAGNIENANENREDNMDEMADNFDEQSEINAVGMENVERNAEELDEIKENNTEFLVDQIDKADGTRAENEEELSNISFNVPPDFDAYHQNELARTYPQGMTEEIYKEEEAGRFTVRRIVVKGNKADEYRKITTKWGTSYFKNGRSSSEYVFDMETYVDD